MRLEKCQSFQEHDNGRGNALLASSASPDSGNWPPRRTGPEKRKVRIHVRPSRSSIAPKMVQDSDMLRGKEDRRAVSDGDDEQFVMRRVQSTRRQRFDVLASEHRESNRLSSGHTAEASHAVVSVSHGLAPFVSVNVNVGSAKASPVGQGQSSGGEPSGRPQSKNFASGVSGANVKWDDKVQRGDTSVYLAADFDAQPGGWCYRPHGGEQTRVADHSFMRNQGLGKKVQETGRSHYVRAPGRAHEVEELRGGFTSSRPDEDEGIEVEDDALPCRLEEHYRNSTRFTRDVQCTSKVLGNNQGNDENWRQVGRVLWTLDREAAAREGDTILRTLRPFESSNKQDASKGRLWSHGGQPYHGLYARSLRANGLDPEHFRSSCCGRHPCRDAAGIDTAVSERAVRYDAHRPEVDKALVESDKDALVAQQGSAPTRGLQDKLEATRVWSSLNQRAELLGTMPPTPLRTKASWMAKPGNAQYRCSKRATRIHHKTEIGMPCRIPKPCFSRLFRPTQEYPRQLDHP